MGRRSNPTLIPLAECDLVLDPVLDDYIQQGALPWDALDWFKAALDAGHLEGWVGVENGRAVGLVAFQARDGWGQIGLLHTLGLPTLDRTLVARAVQDLGRSAGVRSIVATVYRPSDRVREAFEAVGFEEVTRQKMGLELARAPGRYPPPLGYELAPWHLRYREAAAEVMWRANQGQPDAQIYPPLQTLEGCRDLVAKIATGRWGPFLPEASAVALDATGVLVGLLFAQRIAPGTAYVLEVAVLPDCQGRGLGKALVTHCVAQCQALGYPRLRLAVSRRNTAALSLYRAAGFEADAELSAFVWQQENGS
jgi:GNAT superfamily N-acetyltransferase